MLRIILTSYVLLFGTLVFAQETNFIDRKEVQAFIVEMVAKYQFEQDQLTALFASVPVRAKVTTSNSLQVKNHQPWYLYRRIFVNEKRIYQGMLFWVKNQAALARAEEQFGIPASIIVATIGIETNYGANIGKHRVIDALVNLSFGTSNRRDYFRTELIEFLLLTRKDNVDPSKVMGSYAGAIGQPQFMPSSFKSYAVNYSGNKQIDLSNNINDIIGSIANYYQKNGWQKAEPIAVPLSRVGGKYQFSLNRPKTIAYSELVDHGMMATITQNMNNKNYKLIVLQKNYGNEYWIIFHNFDVIRRYNHSDLYAMAVYQLSYYISSLRGLYYA